MTQATKHGSTESPDAGQVQEDTGLQGEEHFGALNVGDSNLSEAGNMEHPPMDAGENAHTNAGGVGEDPGLHADLNLSHIPDDLEEEIEELNSLASDLISGTGSDPGEGAGTDPEGDMDNLLADLGEDGTADVSGETEGSVANDSSADQNIDADLGRGGDHDRPDQGQDAARSPAQVPDPGEAPNLGEDDDPLRDILGEVDFGDDDLDMLDSSLEEETSIKLQLAEAYLELGDMSGALDLIDEVLAEGADEYKAAAQELAARIEGLG